MQNRLKTSKVIILGFGTIILILVMLTGASIYIINQNNQTISNIELKQKQAEDLFIMRNAVQTRALYLFQMTVMDDAFDRDDLYKIYKDEALSFMEAFAELQNSETSNELKSDSNKIKELANVGSNIQNKAAELIYIEEFEKAHEMLSTEVIPVQKNIIAFLTKQHYKQQEFLNNKINSIRRLNISSFWFILIVGLIAIMLSLAISIFVFRHNKETSELEVKKKIAEDENEAKTEFLANMTHELRTPLHAILSYSTFGIRKENASREKRTGYFEKINISGDRLLKLVTNLLDLSKLESGKIDYNFNEVNLAHVLAECLDEITSLLQAKNIKIISTISEGLGTVFCDEALMYQVFQNLLSNAIKFSNNDSNIIVGLEAVKQLSLDKNKFDVVRFSVEDSGIGIESTELDMVFDKFIQSSLTKTGSGGTGLGLAICAEIINGHSGKIWAESDEGQGARFIFEIPLKKEPNASF